MTNLRCVFRRPRFPIISKIGDDLVAGETLREFEGRLRNVALTVAASFDIVDGAGEGWMLHPNLIVISPLTFDKRWTKARVIELFNTSLNAQPSRTHCAT